MKKKNLHIGIIFGTRPEIIKLSALLHLFHSKNISYFTVHTGQHYSPNMDRIFFKELELPEPSYKLKIKSKGGIYHGDHISRMIGKIEDLLILEKPTHLLVQGDTNSVLAASLASSKLSTTRKSTGINILLGHIEAGLRSGDREMPEEINRILTDHASDLLFAPTQDACRNLTKENIPSRKIFVTGNTIVDAVRHNLILAEKKSSVMNRLKLKSGDYAFMTLHRQENVDSKKILSQIVKGIQSAAAVLNLKIIFSMHPRTELMLKKHRIALPDCFIQVKPMGYLDCLMLMSKARILLTDSGGIQEEVCVMRVPCVTIRTTTERPETVKVGANILSGIDPLRIKAAILKMASVKKKSWKNPFGDGSASSQIYRLIQKHRPS